MSEETVVLEACRVWYYSEHDESAFFEWLNKLKCVESYEGQGDTLYITASKTSVDEFCLRELLALFYRYGVDMRQLKAFEREEFSAWFRDPPAYWFKAVFEGDSSTEKTISGDRPRRKIIRGQSTNKT